MEQAQPASARIPASHSRLIGRLLLMVAGAFIFAFAMVPLYNVLCEATGFNGKTTSPKTILNGFGVGGLQVTNTPTSKVDTSRTVRVEFTGTVMPGLPWEMRPLTLSLEIHPGEMQQVSYLVRNTSNRTIVGQAVPSISPVSPPSISKKSSASVFLSKPWHQAKLGKCHSLLLSNQRSTATLVRSPCPMPSSALMDSARY